MTDKAVFHLLLASDGSPTAHAAAATALAFPWPAGTRAHGIVASPIWHTAAAGAQEKGAVARAQERVAAGLRRVLRGRWRGATVEIVDGGAVDVIVQESERLRAGAIVLGWRGFRMFRRLLQGSVSRGVVRHARCAVLVVRRRRRRIRSVVIGVDGSSHARRAVAFVAALPPPSGGRATLVRVVDPPMVPSPAFFRPATQVRMSREFAAVHAEEVARARRDLAAAATRLTRAGWTVRTVVPSGGPLREVLAAVRTARADLLVVGAYGATGLKRLLLGSVAEGALNRCPVPVLVVR